jgi:hypothetical protein
MPTTQLTPVGVGWGNYVIAWLLTYSGSNCELWRIVLQKCMKSEICRELIKLLPTIGYSLAKHKCYDPALIDDLDAEIIDQAPTPPKHQNQSSSITQAISQTNHSKTKAPQSPRRLCPAFPKNHPSLLPLLHTPHLVQWAAPDRGPTDSLA